MISLEWPRITARKAFGYAFFLAVTATCLALYVFVSLSHTIFSIQDTMMRLEQAQTKYESKQAEIIRRQNEELATTRGELAETKKESLATGNKLTSLQESFVKEKTQSKNTVISATDIGGYVNGVAQVICTNDNGSISSGSGSLFTFKELKYAVLTNRHVIDGAERCVVSISNKDSQTLGVYELTESVFSFNKNTDTAVIGIGKAVSSAYMPLSSYNYALATLRKCSSNISIGSPAVIIGFPAYAKRDAETTIDTIGKVKTIYRTVTNGIVSGYDSSQTKPNGALTDANFFISAKIDSGNSGGMALAKDSDGLCSLGIPTWLTVGNYETQGLVQNIRNILPQ